jgi:hypothetical protein
VADSILEQISTRVTAELVKLQPNVATRFGSKLVADNTVQLPRIVWVPEAKEGFGPSDDRGHVQNVLRMRVARVVLHIRAETTGDVEALINDVCIACSKVARASFDFVAGEWKSEHQAQSSAGAAYLLTLEFKIPLVERSLTLVKPVAATVTHVAVLPSGNVTTP